mmetsp:Transcript_2564/g.9297  ORF Transcript_2564/g.9297 Transcript_2564/m.9297 type:complete len:335 (+) Transcript_2564:896-1900(+)
MMKMFEFAAGFPLQFHLLEVCFPCVLSIACQGIQWDSSVPHLLCVEEQHAEPRHIHEDQSHIAGIERATRAVAASDGCACTPVNVWLWARHDPEGLHVAIDKDPYVQEADHVIVCQPSRLSRLLLLLQLAALHRVVVQHAQAVQHACAQLASREAISVDQCTRRLLVCGASARHPHEHVAVIAERSYAVRMSDLHRGYLLALHKVEASSSQQLRDGVGDLAVEARVLQALVGTALHSLEHAEERVLPRGLQHLEAVLLQGEQLTRARIRVRLHVTVADDSQAARNERGHSHVAGPRSLLLLVPCSARIAAATPLRRCLAASEGRAGGCCTSEPE